MKTTKPVYSVVVPVFNEEAVCDECYRRLKDVMDRSGSAYELIFINDGSRDRTLSILKSIHAEDPSAKIINFSRNFGHQIAISAGMDYAAGDAVIVIDADLQDPPEVILDMMEKWKEGYHVVYGKRTRRKGETLFKKITARLFYRMLKQLTNVDIPVDVGDFRLIDRRVCDAMKKLREKNRFIRGLVSWLGFSQTEVLYEREKRFAGSTKYPLRKMINFMLDAVTSFSYIPLKIATFIGSLTSLAGFAYLLIVLYQRLFTDKTIQGWASMVSLTLIFNGIILLILGIIGEYIGRIYDESKNRPLYIVQDLEGFAEDEVLGS
ncbi:MAG: glycosyltransferase family 2 protein [Spirochaetales bacterium]|nr:glycosyltransferase family 2 protein [Spirochaetales bacterium]